MRGCILITHHASCSFRQSERSRQTTTSSSTFFCCLSPPFGSLLFPPLPPFHFSSTSFSSTVSPSTPPLHRETGSIPLRSKRWSRHGLLYPADCPFPVCLLSWGTGSFSAIYLPYTSTIYLPYTFSTAVILRMVIFR